MNLTKKLHEFEKLLKQAQKLIKSDSSAEQAVVVLTSKGTMFSFINKNITSGNVEAEISFVRKLEENKDIEIRYIICMWGDASLDVPSCHLRNMLAELDVSNQNTEILLKSGEGFQVKSMKALVSPPRSQQENSSEKEDYK